jgi:hypothetical protein
MKKTRREGYSRLYNYLRVVTMVHNTSAGCTAVADPLRYDAEVTMAIDPVCKMEVAESTAPAKSEYR